MGFPKFGKIIYIYVYVVVLGVPTIMENQREKNMENEMETVVI